MRVPLKNLRRQSYFTSLWQLMRPKHWVKNLFVLAGLFFAQTFHDPKVISQGMLALWAFCFISSAVYAFNDVRDVERDRLHPRKRLRPVAAGHVSVAVALLVSLLLAVAGLLLAYQVSLPLLFTGVGYLAVNTAYSHGLKRVVLLDVFSVATGFALRLMAGTWGLGIPPSQWFLLCTFLLSLFLGFSKRYAERMDPAQAEGDKREVVAEYTPEFLRALLSATLAATLMAYGLYTLSPRTLEVHHTGDLILTLPVAAYALFRYLYLVLVKGFGEDTAAEVLRDRSLFWAVIAYIALTSAILFRG